MSRTTWHQWARAGQLCLLGGMLACGSDNAAPGGNPPAIAKAAAASGDAQTGAAGAQLGAPIRVVVTQDGAAKAGVSVGWTAAAGGAVAPTSSTTDATGIASTAWTLGAAAGDQTAQATLAGASGSPVVFHATATAAGGATTLAKAATANGDGQSGAPSTALPQPLAVVVTDGTNPKSGVTITWTAQNGGSMSPTTSVSDASGNAASTWTLGPVAGSQTATASVTGATGSPVTFTGTSTGSAANTIQLVDDVNGPRFDPSTLTVSAGTTVSFVWVSSTHDVTSDGPPSFASSGAPNGPPRTYQVTFNTAGTYQFHCSVHGAPGTGMHGTITVQ